MIIVLLAWRRWFESNYNYLINMNSLIYPVDNNQVTVFSIGDIYTVPNYDEIRDIRSWTNGIDPTLISDKLLGYSFKVKVWPKIPNYYEYAWMITSPTSSVDFAHKDENFYDNCMVKTIREDNVSFYIWGAISIKRINKNLCPFI